MSRAAEYRFVDSDTQNLETQLVSLYESITGTSVQPASPEKLFIQWVASIVLLQRILINYTGNQNIPSRAEGKNLDAIGQQLYMTERPQAAPAVSTERFYITQEQPSAVLIPLGTRVSDAGNALVWATTRDAEISAGELFVDIPIQCQTTGAAGNGYLPGQICKLVDVFLYYDKCENVTVSDGGANKATDDEYYELLRTSVDKYSCAGAKGSYIYFAKQASVEIGDVAANSHAPGYVDLYVLTKDGGAASEEVKNAVLAACSPDHVRAFTDCVAVHDPEFVPYDIDATYYLPDTGEVAQIQENILAAAREYMQWQSGKIGRDIDGSELIYRLKKAGAKRVELTAPVYVRLLDGSQNKTVPQVAALRETRLLNGGIEDE